MKLTPAAEQLRRLHGEKVVGFASAAQIKSDQSGPSQEHRRAGMEAGRQGLMQVGGQPVGSVTLLPTGSPSSQIQSGRWTVTSAVMRRPITRQHCQNN